MRTRPELSELGLNAGKKARLHAGVADAVRLGADAVEYTLYVGTPAAEADFAQYPR